MIYDMVYESKITFGNEVCRLNEALKELDEVLNRLCNKLMGIPNGAAIVFAEIGLGSEQERQVHRTDCKELVPDYESVHRISSKTML